MRKSLLKVVKYFFITILGFLILFFCLVFFPLSQIDFPEKNYDHLLIENISIVDVENDTIYENQKGLI